MSYEIIWEENGVKIITTGAFGNDFLDANIKATTDPRFVNTLYAIVDFTKVKEFSVDSNITQQLAKSDSKAYKINPNMKLAILANNLVITGLTNMYKTYFEISNNEISWEMRIFETENEAREWIYT